MSLKEKNKPSKNAWVHWLKSEAISIVMEFKNKAFGGSPAGVGVGWGAGRREQARGENVQ